MRTVQFLPYEGGLRDASEASSLTGLLRFNPFKDEQACYRITSEKHWH